MSPTRGFQQTLPELFPGSSGEPASRSYAMLQWDAPTFSEFVRRIEHEFGNSIDLSPLPLTSADGDERLSPGSVRSLCELLGVPPEDLGV